MIEYLFNKLYAANKATHIVGFSYILPNKSIRKDTFVKANLFSIEHTLNSKDFNRLVAEVTKLEEIAPDSLDSLYRGQRLITYTFKESPVGRNVGVHASGALWLQMQKLLCTQYGDGVVRGHIFYGIPAFLLSINKEDGTAILARPAYLGSDPSHDPIIITDYVFTQYKFLLNHLKERGTRDVSFR